MKKQLFTTLAIAAFSGVPALSQTNLQTFYDFGSDRQQITSTLEGFYGDNWGNTFFFVDYDYCTGKSANKSFPNGTYFEIARCLNFWQESALAPLSLHIEYNGGVYRDFGVNHAFLAGADWFLHSKDFSNTLNIKLLYKYIADAKSNVPMQFTLVWGMQDIFGLKGLRFSGFADFWWEDHLVSDGMSHSVFISEPQLWYNVGSHFGVDNLNVGGEVELSYDFGAVQGFRCRPCLGCKWVF